MSKGFAILAFNNQTTDYVALAATLRNSIHRVMPDAKVCLITDSDVQDPKYDRVIKVDSVDSTEWKLGNDWLVYQHTPYDRTIKLEADLYIPRRIDHWWDILEERDLNICTTIRTYKNDVASVEYYRRALLENNLPDTYNAITYFRKSATASTFFKYVRDIFENPAAYGDFTKSFREERITTDVVYGIAATIVGVENCTMPTFTDFSMIHMKKMINGLKTDRWHDQLVYEIHPHTLRIATHPQLYPFHYHNKDFAAIIDQEIGNE
jgi:hypothetical protein